MRLAARLRSNDPSGYLPAQGLVGAVNIALRLGQPLLLTGEPGTGKTQLAVSIANELRLPSPLLFNVKTTSTARDLYYRYDATRHLNDTRLSRNSIRVEDYITYEALGLAILLAMDLAEADEFLPFYYRDQCPTRSVVLIDEIDKAPPDMPIDALNAIEKMSFAVQETSRTFVADARYRPILVLTSNSETNLPEVLLSRCVYYHILFPSEDHLRHIVKRNLPNYGISASRIIENAVSEFVRIRGTPDLRRLPTISELLAWVRILCASEIDVGNLNAGQVEAFVNSYSVLAKTKEDLHLLQRRAWSVSA